MEWDSNSGEPGIGGRGIRELCLLLNFSVTLKLSIKKKKKKQLDLALYTGQRPMSHLRSTLWTGLFSRCADTTWSYVFLDVLR